MKRLLIPYYQFSERLDTIQLYIDMTFSKNNELEHVENLLTKEIYKSVISYFKTLRTSTIQYNAVVISLYGCFENFVDTLFSEYVNIVFEKSRNMEDIPPKMIAKYRLKVGEYLSAPQRFNAMDLSEIGVVTDYHNILTSCLTETINPKLLVSHSGNLHISELLGLMTDLGIENSKTSILDSHLLKKYFVESVGIELKEFDLKKRRAASDIKNSELLEPLERLVSQRNSVAHSWNEGNRITAHDFSSAIIPFLGVLAKIVLEICFIELFKKIPESEYSFINKSPINVFNNHILCLNSQGINLKSGDFILYKSNGKNKCSCIKNIQRNGKDIIEVKREQSIDIGIQLENTVKSEDEICYVISG